MYYGGDVLVLKIGVISVMTMCMNGCGFTGTTYLSINLKLQKSPLVTDNYRIHTI